MDKSNVTQLHPKDKNQKEEASLVSSLSPREIVSELDRFVVGQNKAKRAVAVALRNRWRRQALKGEMKNEVLPKNILMIGPTGVGKTEISRRLSKLAEAPFVKVEATRFTEVGYVGRDVEQIVRDLIEIAISMEKVKKRKEVFTQAQKAAEEKVLDALVGKKASLATRESFRKRLRNGDLDDNEIEIAVSDTGSSGASFEIPGMPGANVGMINIGEMIGQMLGGIVPDGNGNGIGSDPRNYVNNNEGLQVLMSRLISTGNVDNRRASEEYLKQLKDNKIDAQFYDAVEDGRTIVTLDLSKKIKMNELEKGVVYEFKFNSLKAPLDKKVIEYLKTEKDLVMDAIYQFELTEITIVDDGSR